MDFGNLKPSRGWVYHGHCPQLQGLSSTFPLDRVRSNEVNVDPVPRCGWLGLFWWQVSILLCIDFAQLAFPAGLHILSDLFPHMGPHKEPTYCLFHSVLSRMDKVVVHPRNDSPLECPRDNYLAIAGYQGVSFNFSDLEVLFACGQTYRFPQGIRSRVQEVRNIEPQGRSIRTKRSIEVPEHQEHCSDTRKPLAH